MQRIDRNVYGPWALVTGASSGIGAEFARQAAASGINVVLVARDNVRLAAGAASLRDRYGVETREVSVDLRSDGFLEPIRKTSQDIEIGLVVSNAGAGSPGPFVSLPMERLREIVQLNVVAHLELAHHFGGLLARRGRGGIILVSAAAAVGGLPYMANDSATKAYPLNLGEALHDELEPSGVHVSVLVPVLVSTPVMEQIGLGAAGLPIPAISPEEAVDQALTALVENRATTPSRGGLAGDYAQLKGAVIDALKSRIAARQPAH